MNLLNVIQQLEKLAELYEKQILTEEEFIAQKKIIFEKLENENK
jgi:hypothetical protein